MPAASTEPPRIAIMARAPVPGAAKTRLIPALGPAGAAELHEHLLTQSIATALAAELGPVTLWCTPDTGHPAFQRALRQGVRRLRAQTDGDLGARMLAACDVDDARDDRTIAPTLVMGTDCPALTSAHLRQAAACLAAGDDAILVPAEDGGYVLIGLRQAYAGVFTDIDWGSGKVLQQTRRKLARLGWHWREPVRLWDVDRPEDLPRLRQLAP